MLCKYISAIYKHQLHAQQTIILYKSVNYFFAISIISIITINLQCQTYTDTAKVQLLTCVTKWSKPQNPALPQAHIDMSGIGMSGTGRDFNECKGPVDQNPGTQHVVVCAQTENELWGNRAATLWQPCQLPKKRFPGPWSILSAGEALKLGAGKFRTLSIKNTGSGGCAERKKVWIDRSLPSASRLSVTCSTGRALLVLHHVHAVFTVPACTVRCKVLHQSRNLLFI